MMSYIWPIALVVVSNIFYQICAKSVPSEMDAMASLTVTYLVGAACSAVMFFVLNPGAACSGSTPSSTRPPCCWESPWWAWRWAFSTPTRPAGR